MALRDILDSDSFRHGKVLPAVFAVLIALIAWFGIQIFFFVKPSEPGATASAVQQSAPAPAQQQTASAVASETVPQPALETEVTPPVYPKLLVARRDIQSGVMLVSELVEWRDWREPIDLNMAVLRDAVPLQAILGSVTRLAYTEGTPIAWDGIITPDVPGFIGAVLEPGMRAVTVEVDRATTNANIIFPGDRVDVIMVTTSEGTLAVSQAIIRDARVLAVGSTVLSLGRYGRVNLTKAGAIEPVNPPAGENYTLEVIPIDAERIALAVATGRLTLAMRSAAAAPPAQDTVMPRPVRLSEVLIEPKAPPPPPGAPPVRVIRVIRGGVADETVAVRS